MSFNLSIIIPTCNRPRILQKTLDCIAVQTLLAPSFDTRRRVTLSSPSRSEGVSKGRYGATQEDTPLEVIVVSDGPDEKTAELITSMEWPFAIQYFAIPKIQQGVCRNRAVEKARSPLVLLIGDDIFLAPDACERHVKVHAMLDEKAIVLGHITWDPSMKVTPLMKWMEESGVQFGYGKIEKFRKNFLPADIQHWFTYTSNLSLPAKLLYQNKFREDVSLYGWEDIEWGKRLAAKDIPLYYEPDAQAYHHHPYTADEVWQRSRQLGKSAVIMEKLNPSLQLLPCGLKKMAYRVLSLLPTYRGRHYREFLYGVNSE